jgi:hypothetical protein
MTLFDRLRSAVAGFRYPGTTLVRVGRPDPLPGSRPRRALPAPQQPPRPRLPRSGGWSSAYGRVITPDPYRQQPLGRGWADPRPIIRDQASAWRAGGPDVSGYGWDKQSMLADLFPGWEPPRSNYE